ncbi:MAG: Gfo/Idh/MocA family protein [Candidatus Fervidibacter sp.]|uniref:Gfo/Idh/MocA family protein n=1 Tax=Candidatus Fervidibacter sp. TaxID=3100871 RepID=UPI0040491B91
MKRRDFLGGTLALGLVSTHAFSQNSKSSPNERIGLGFIGVGPRGMALLQEFRRFPDVDIVAVCDVHQERVDRAVAATEGKAMGLKDFRDVLDRKDIDAVVIATPPHWHALVSIMACQAEKDVYCEKPMCLTVDEAKAMVWAAERYKRVTQVGTQIHSGQNFRRVVEVVRSGMLGKITFVRTFVTENLAPNGVGNPPDSEPPSGLDWDMWCGPSKLRPFNQAVFSKHYFFRDYAGCGLLHNMGPHVLDLAFWALELKAPKSVLASGGKFALQDISDVPDTLEVVYNFEDLVLVWSHSEAFSFGFELHEGTEITRRLGIVFHGTNGTLAANYTTFKLFPEGDRLDPNKLPEPSIPPSPGHTREWLDGIKTRQQPLCHFGYHYWIQLAISLGDIAYMVGQKIIWDNLKGRIVGDEEANRMLTPNYRKPWEFPKQV